jgi:chromosome segregation ATPase
MNLAGKIFVVLNLILAVAFAVASLSLYAKKVDWVEQTREFQQKYNVQLERADALESDLSATEATLAQRTSQLEERISGLESNLRRTEQTLTTAEKDKTQLEGSLDRLDDSFNSLQAKLGKAQDLVTEKEEELRQKTDELQKLRQDLQYLRETAFETAADLREAEAELQDANARLAQLMEQNIEMRIMLEDYRQRYPGLEKAALKGPAVPVRGKVLKVDESVNLAIVNLGEKDEMKAGLELVVSRGDDYVGVVKIRTVYPEMSSAVIDKDMTVRPIRVGDAAETQ